MNTQEFIVGDKVLHIDAETAYEFEMSGLPRKDWSDYCEWSPLDPSIKRMAKKTAKIKK